MTSQRLYGPCVRWERLQAEAEVGAFDVVLLLDASAQAVVVSGLLEGVEPADDVIGAQVGQFCFDGLDVSFEPFLDGDSDGLPLLFGLLQRGVGYGDGALVGSSLPSAESVGWASPSIVEGC